MDDLEKAFYQGKKGDTRGKLKIFLGMAAGVGKTYSMLEAAQKAQREGRDLLVATIETHGRPETAALLEGLRRLPEKEVSYRGLTIRQLDLDGVLAAKPEIAVVDELAHSNVGESRHPKRWQDVIELLDAGIDVYTTLNVQHIESLKEVVEGIVGTTVRETVPDLIIEQAAEIELIDLTPAELLQRLHEGKVYLGSQGEVAAENFFQPDRLTALREMVLRFTAEKVDHDLHAMVSTIRRAKGWKAREKLMVCITPAPEAQKLIRKARRLAFNFDASWIVLHVNTGSPLAEAERDSLAKNLALARELGAEVITTDDVDLIQGIAHVATERRVTQIIIGRARRPTIWRLFRRSKLLARLAQLTQGIDVHIVDTAYTLKGRRPRGKKKTLVARLLGYALAIGVVGLLSIIGSLIFTTVSPPIIGLLFLVGILCLSPVITFGPNLLAALLFSLIYGLFFSSWPLSQTDIGLIVVNFILAIGGSALTHRAKIREELLNKRQKSIEAIYSIVREIASAPSREQLFRAVKSRLQRVIGGTCDICLGEEDQLSFERTSALLESESERAVATWVYKNGKEAGLTTSTLPGSKALFLPLKGFQQVVGVLAFTPDDPKSLTPEAINLLYTVAQQLAAFLERSLAESKEREFKHLSQIEEIHQKILRLLSDEFQSPLAIITEVTGRLRESLGAEQQQPVRELQGSLESLLRMVQNISSMSTLSSGLISPSKMWHPITKLIDACCGRIQKQLKEHQLSVTVAEGFPELLFDFNLLQLLLENLLINAVEYSPPKTQIAIEAHLIEKGAALTVTDEGPGIPSELLDLVFEKFYRVPGTEVAGIGLGLAIAKAIAEIHGGHLRAENRPEGGARFLLILPT